MGLRVTRDEIVASARSWIGTPYRHQHCAKGAGCDCLGLIRGVWREIYGREPEAAPPYSADWGESGRVEVLHAACARHMNQIDLEQAVAGDVVLFRMIDCRIAKHLAILSTAKTMIHAYSGCGVREEAFSDAYRHRAVCAFEFPGLS